MALHVISAARKPSSILGTPGRFVARDRWLKFVAKLGQMAGSGPPAFRNQQLLALIDAGLVTFLGAQPAMTIEKNGFALASPTTGNEKVHASTLIDAYVHSPDARRPSEPIVAGLRRAGRSRPYVFPDGTVSRSPEIEQETGRLIRQDGTPDPRIYALGIPLADVRADTTISPLPGSDSTLLQETDLVAAHLLTS